MTLQSSEIPSETDAATAVRAALGAEPRALRRFPTGLCHFVYDVELTDGRRVVARLASADNAHLLEAGVTWSALLRPRGVPLPAVLASDFHARVIPFPFVLLERLPGVDLGVAYGELTRADKKRIAVEIVRIQGLVHTLPAGRRFGHTTTPDDAPHASWSAVLEALLEASAPELARLELGRAQPLERVRARLEALRPALDRVAPTPFLDDATTKNVIVDAGRLTGIVDVDELCYGDPLLTVGLTQMSLLHAGHDLDYTEAWMAVLALSSERRELVRLYAALFGVGFLAELGQRFNRDAAPQVDAAVVARLLGQLDALL